MHFLVRGFQQKKKLGYIWDPIPTLIKINEIEVSLGTVTQTMIYVRNAWAMAETGWGLGLRAGSRTAWAPGGRRAVTADGGVRSNRGAGR